MGFRVSYRAGRATCASTPMLALFLLMVTMASACDPYPRPAPSPRPKPALVPATPPEAAPQPVPAPPPPAAPAPVVAPPPAPEPAPSPQPERGLVRLGGQQESATGELVSTSAAAFAGIRFSRRMEMSSTAYCLKGHMRTGVRTRDGMAAGDPSVLPLGSVVRVTHGDGRLIGVFVIMDTGGAIRGNKIDIYMDSCREASDWGRRPVIVEVLDIGRS